MRSGFSPMVLRSLVGDKVFARGQQYAREGQVRTVRRFGDTFYARVYGSADMPYTVRLAFDGERLRQGWCTCPYAEDGTPCKHLVAVLLHLPHKHAPEGPSLDDALDALPPDDLRALVRALLDAAPEVAFPLARLLAADDGDEEDGEEDWKEHDSFGPSRPWTPTPDPNDTSARLLVLLEKRAFRSAVRLADAQPPDALLRLDVAEAVAADEPGWVLAQGDARVAALLALGKGEAYDAAARWLVALRTACLAENRPDAWRERLADVRTRFRRKHGFLHALDTHLARARAAEA